MDINQEELRILIVDDEVNLSKGMERIFRKNFKFKEIVLAHNGKDAWKELMESDFDLIMSDWNMPQQNGYDLLCKVRDHEKTKDIPFLMMTGTSDKESIISAKEAGVSGYVVKPFNTKTIIDKIIQTLSNYNKSTLSL